MFKLKRVKKVRTVAEKFLRFKIISLSSIAVLLGGIFALIFLNYDYMQFRLLIAGNYIHTDTLDEMFATHLGFVPENYGRYFDNLVIAVVTQEIRRVGGDGFTYQYTPTMRQAQRDRVAQQANQAEIAEIAPGVGYLWLPNISPLVENFVMDNKATLASFDNLVLDLRGNSGGNLSVSQAIAGLFLERQTVIGIDQARHNIFTRQRRASGNVYLDFDQIIILQDYRTASASESLIAALQANLDNVTTIGQTSVGKAVGQVTLPMRRGFAVRATVIYIQTPDGGSIHNIGLPPDIYLDIYEDFIEIALRLLNG